MTFDRSVRFKKTLPALKHGGYAATIVLPGENSAEFEQLHQELIAELAPNGALETDIVGTIAGLVWRKQNLGTFRIAELAQKRAQEIKTEKFEAISPEAKKRLMEHAQFHQTPLMEERIRDGEDQARKELGDTTYELVEVGVTATFGRLMTELGVEDRLDSMIDKCLKRLLYLRGLKSISSASSSITAPATAR